MNDSKPTPEYFEQLQNLFEKALELPEEQRDEFLQSASPADDNLRNEVKALLAAHHSDDGRLSSPVSAATDAWIGKKVGAYEIIRLIGVGGMGAVDEGRRDD